MKYIKLLEKFLNDDKVQWVKIHKVGSKTESKKVDALTDLAKNKLFNMFFMNPELMERTKKKKLDHTVPTLRYGGSNKDVIKYIEDNKLDKSTVYNWNTDAINLSSDKKLWHQKLEGKNYIPKTVYDKKDLSKLKFPIIAKPSIGHSGIGIKKFETIEEANKDKGTFDLYSECIDFISEYRIMFIKDNPIVLYERIVNKKYNKTIETKGLKEEVNFIYIQQNMDKTPFMDQIKDIQQDFRKLIELDCYSLDFFVDKKDKVWMIESNSNSGLGANSLACVYKGMYEDFYGKKPPKTKMDIVNKIIREYADEMKKMYSEEYKETKYPQ